MDRGGDLLISLEGLRSRGYDERRIRFLRGPHTSPLGLDFQTFRQSGLRGDKTCRASMRKGSRLQELSELTVCHAEWTLNFCKQGFDYSRLFACGRGFIEKADERLRCRHDGLGPLNDVFRAQFPSVQGLVGIFIGIHACPFQRDAGEQTL